MSGPEAVSLVKAVIAHRDGTPHVVELDRPPLGPATVAVRVSHSALLLPQELDAIPGVAKRLKKGQDGLPLGMMVSGIVDEVGEGVEGLKAGLRIAAFGAPYVYHATHLSIPASLVVELPKKVNHEEGAFVGQGAIAVQQVRESRATLGETVVVFGAGMAGQLAAQVVRAAGANAIIVDEVDHRLTKARNVGIASAFSPGDEALVRDLSAATQGEGADAAIVTADAAAGSLERAASFLRAGGRLVVATGSAEGLPAGLVMEKELHVCATANAGAGHGDPAWERRGLSYPRSLVRWTVRGNMEVFLALLAERKVQVSPLISERMPMDRAAACYERLERTRGTVIGAVFTA